METEIWKYGLETIFVRQPSWMNFSPHELTIQFTITPIGGKKLPGMFYINFQLIYNFKHI